MHVLMSFLRARRSGQFETSYCCRYRTHGQYYKDTDLDVGLEMEVYGRVFRIVDANESTRRYYLEVHNYPRLLLCF